MRHIVIVGATSVIASHCARCWASSGIVDLTLIGRDAQGLDALAMELRILGPGATVHVLTVDFLDPVAIARVADACIAGGPLDTVLIAHGARPDQIDCQANLIACRDALEINAISPVLFAEAFAAHLARAGRGRLAIIGSVTGDRGRKSNYIYGAAKGLLARLAEGMQHRFAATDVKIVLIKPGPTDTPMSAHLRGANKKLASPEVVACGIITAIERGAATVYLPGKWRWIMATVRHIPGVLFNRLDL
jgi:short-subunit dehydrogenase